MATYATQSDFEAYSIGWTTTDPVALEKILEQAERDVDRVLGNMGDRPAAQVLKVVPSELDARDRDALMRATCAQAEYIIQMGPAFFRQGQHQSVSGPKFATTGQLPRIGPRVKEELSAFTWWTGSWSTVLR